MSRPVGQIIVFLVISTELITSVLVWKLPFFYFNFGLLLAVFAVMILGFDATITLCIIGLIGLFFSPMATRSGLDNYFPYQQIYVTRFAEANHADSQILIGVVSLFIFIIIGLALKSRFLCDPYRRRVARNILLFCPFVVALLFSFLNLGMISSWPIFFLVIFFFSFFATLVDYMADASAPPFEWRHFVFFLPVWTPAYLGFLRNPTLMKTMQRKKKREKAYCMATGFVVLTASIFVGELVHLMQTTSPPEWLTRTGVTGPFNSFEIFWNFARHGIIPSQPQLWVSLFYSAIFQLLFISSIDMFWGGTLRLLGFQIPISPQRPWAGGIGFASKFRRIYYYYSQFVMENYFLPVFIRLKNLNREMRLFFAFLFAIILGSLGFHLSRGILALMLFKASGMRTLLLLLPLAFYFLALTLLIFARPFRKLKYRPPLILQIFDWIFFVFLYGSLLFFRPAFVSGDMTTNFKLFRMLYGF